MQQYLDRTPNTQPPKKKKKKNKDEEEDKPKGRVTNHTELGFVCLFVFFLGGFFSQIFSPKVGYYFLHSVDFFPFYFLLFSLLFLGGFFGVVKERGWGGGVRWEGIFFFFFFVCWEYFGLRGRSLCVCVWVFFSFVLFL